MNKLLSLLCLCVTVFTATAQQDLPSVQSYGKVNQSDLELKSCDYEKDANAEILFEKGEIKNGVLYKHVRIKIFNAEAVQQHANFREFFLNTSGVPPIESFKGETINYENGKPVFIPIDKKQVYIKSVDRYYAYLAFTFPDVKPGSILEYKYSCPTDGSWYFQNDLPTRYSELEADFSGWNKIKYVPHVTRPFTKSVGDALDNYQDRVLTNIHSLNKEPFMTSRLNNSERLEFTLDRSLTWKGIGTIVSRITSAGQQFNRTLTGENDIIKQVKTLKSQDEKISFIYNQVKNSMKWNDVISCFTNDGTVEAWNQKTGNSAEINIILYHLLKAANINAYPMAISTKDYLMINPANPDPYILKNMVVYVPIDLSDPDNPQYYVLDATNKYNLFNEVPKEELNTFGLLIDKDNDESRLVFMQNQDPVLNIVYVTADISADGKMSGNALLTNYGYKKVDNVSDYKKNGEEKFKEYLNDNNNNLTIQSLKLDNIDVDSLPLLQNINFKYDIAGDANDYIYFAPNMFIIPHANPFLSENRYSDIDFGYRDRTLFNGVFKIPAGYKVDALPKDIVMIMPDTSITFRRTINEQDGTIAIRYSIDQKKTMFFKENYPEFYQFFKKMYEMLSEQIVLKKS